MSEGLNKVMLLGNLGADPELKMTGGGQAILKLRLATAESYLDRNNTRQERTEWHSVTVWGKRAEGLAKILAKGDRIFVEGSIRTSSYEKDGEKRYRTEVNALSVLLCGGKGAGESTGSSRSSGRSAPPPPTPKPDAFGGSAGDYASDSYDDDVPFAIDAMRLGWWRP